MTSLNKIAQIRMFICQFSKTAVSCSTGSSKSPTDAHSHHTLPNSNSHGNERHSKPNHVNSDEVQYFLKIFSALQQKVQICEKKCITNFLRAVNNGRLIKVFVSVPLIHSFPSLLKILVIFGWNQNCYQNFVVEFSLAGDMVFSIIVNSGEILKISFNPYLNKTFCFNLLCVSLRVETFLLLILVSYVLKTYPI